MVGGCNDMSTRAYEPREPLTTPFVQIDRVHVAQDSLKISWRITNEGRRRGCYIKGYRNEKGFEQFIWPIHKLGLLIMHSSSDDGMVERVPADKEYFYTFVICDNGWWPFRGERPIAHLRFKFTPHDAIRVIEPPPPVTPPPVETPEEIRAKQAEARLKQVLAEVEAACRLDTNLAKSEREFIKRLQKQSWFQALSEKERDIMISRVRNQYRGARVER